MADSSLYHSPPIRIHFRPRCLDEIQHQMTVKMSSDSLAFFPPPFFFFIERHTGGILKQQCLKCVTHYGSANPISSSAVTPFPVKHSDTFLPPHNVKEYFKISPFSRDGVVWYSKLNLVVFKRKGGGEKPYRTCC